MDDAEGQSQRVSIHQFGVYSVSWHEQESSWFGLLKAQCRCAESTGSLKIKKWDMSRVKGAPWDFKAKAGHDINDAGIPERVEPDPPIEIPPRINVRRMYIRRMDVEKCCPTKGCPGCQKVMRGTVPSCIVATHRLMMQDPVGADRVVRTKTRHDEAFTRHVEEHKERENMIARHITDAQEMTHNQPSS